MHEVVSRKFANYTLIELTPEEIASLSSAELKFLTSATLILNDIKFFLSATAGADMDGTSIDVRRMQLIRSIWFSRKFASIIYEAQIALRRDAKSLPHIAGQLTNGTNFPFSDPRSNKYLATAKKIRDSHSNHYDVKDVSDLTHQLFGNPVCIGYVHENSINSIYGLSEEFLVAGTFNLDTSDKVWDFFNWCYHCAGEISVFCESNIGEILMNHFPGKVFQERPIEMGVEMSDYLVRIPICQNANKQ